MRALLAQTRAEVAMTLRRGETLLLTLGIPLLLLVFFSEVSILPTPGVASVDLVTPGILALAIMSTSMVSLGIATGFERAPRGHRPGGGLLRLLDRARPLGRRRAAAGHRHLPLPRRLTQKRATPASSRAGVVGPRWTPVTMPLPLTKTVSGRPKNPNLPEVTA